MRRNAPTLYRVARDCDRVRCVRISHTDTQEWQEREAARRARQKVPKAPPQAFRVRRSSGAR